MKSFALAVFAIFVLSGCKTQTSSGDDYLQKHRLSASAVSSSAGNKTFEQALVKAASVKPTLAFPARIGLARVDRGSLEAIPGEEMELWMKAAKNLGKDFGEFVPLSKLVMNVAAGEVMSRDDNLTTMNMIRLGAARQHVDAVLVYEIYSSVDSEDNLLEVGKLTIIGGYILPSKQYTAKAYSTAMLMDVMSGYPYGTIHATVPKQERLASSWGWGSDNASESREAVELSAVEKLSAEAESMFRQLRTELSQKSTKKRKP